MVPTLKFQIQVIFVRKIALTSATIELKLLENKSMSHSQQMSIEQKQKSKVSLKKVVFY